MFGWQSQWIKWILDTFLCDAIIEYNLCQIRISFYQKPEIKDKHTSEDYYLELRSFEFRVAYKGVTTPQVSIHGAHTTLLYAARNQNGLTFLPFTSFLPNKRKN